MAVRNVPIPNQNFGLYHGVRLRGRVFNDNGAGGGTANDGILNGAEAGLAGFNLRLTDASGAPTYGTTISATDGAFALALPASIPNGTTLTY